MRRVITQIDSEGVSTISSAAEPRTVVRFGPGFEVHELWRLDEPPSSALDGSDPERYTFELSRGAVFRVVVIPPDDIVMESLRKGEKWGANSPYRTTGDDYGLHGTNTLDFVTVVSGRVDLRMPDGDQTRLEAGDAVVQRGAVHSWRNPGPESVILHAVMFGTGH